MGDELKGFEETAPTLTLEPDLGEAKPAAPAVPEAEAVKKEMEQTILTPEEQQMVDSFAQKIDIENTNQILQYGAGTQKKMADFSENALKMYAPRTWAKSEICYPVWSWNSRVLRSQRRTRGF